MDETPVKRGRGRPKGSTDKASRGGRKLTPTDVMTIRDLADENVPYDAIQERFRNGGVEITRQTISLIVLRKIWKNVA